MNEYQARQGHFPGRTRQARLAYSAATAKMPPAHGPEKGLKRCERFATLRGKRACVQWDTMPRFAPRFGPYYNVCNQGLRVQCSKRYCASGTLDYPAGADWPPPQFEEPYDEATNL